MANIRKVTAGCLNEIVGYLESGYTKTQAAQMAGISPSALRNAEKENWRVRQRINKAWWENSAKWRRNLEAIAEDPQDNRNIYANKYLLDRAEQVRPGDSATGQLDSDEQLQRIATIHQVWSEGFHDEADEDLLDDVGVGDADPVS